MDNSKDFAKEIMTNPKPITIPCLKRLKKQGEKITMLTAYDYPTAKIVNEAGVHIILVGDSVGMVVLGYENTLPVTMEEILHHTKAVNRGIKDSAKECGHTAFLVADMPFLSFQVSVSETVRNAGLLLKEGGAQAVKLEGGRRLGQMIDALVACDIPVMGHLGLTPQSVHVMGGLGSIQGKKATAAQKFLEDALYLQEAGVFSIVLEGMPWQVAKKITESLQKPTIGIAAGPYCDGQVLVLHDILGLYDAFTPKHAKKYVDLRSIIKNAVSEYIDEVKNGQFPTLEQAVSLKPEEEERFLEDDLSAVSSKFTEKNHLEE